MRNDLFRRVTFCLVVFVVFFWLFLIQATCFALRPPGADRDTSPGVAIHRVSYHAYSISSSSPPPPPPPLEAIDFRLLRPGRPPP